MKAYPFIYAPSFMVAVLVGGAASFCWLRYFSPVHTGDERLGLAVTAVIYGGSLAIVQLLGVRQRWRWRIGIVIPAWYGAAALTGIYTLLAGRYFGNGIWSELVEGAFAPIILILYGGWSLALVQGATLLLGWLVSDRFMRSAKEQPVNPVTRRLAWVVGLMVALAAIIPNPLTLRTEYVTKCMVWRISSTEERGHPGVVLWFGPPYSGFEISMYSQSLADYLQKTGKPEVDVVFAVTRYWGHMRGFDTPRIGEWVRDGKVILAGSSGGGPAPDFLQ